jgi:hypothetical protein
MTYNLRRISTFPFTMKYFDIKGLGGRMGRFSRQVEPTSDEFFFFGTLLPSKLNEPAE